MNTEDRGTSQAQAPPIGRGPSVAAGTMHKAIVLRWWRQATPVASSQSPTLMRPVETHDLGGGEVIEVHRDDSGKYRAILVRRKGSAEEIRLLP